MLVHRESSGASIPPKKAKDDCLQREQLAWVVVPLLVISIMRIISAYLQTLLITGARREEIAGIKWADIDFRWKSMTIKDKVEGQRVIPLTPYVASLLWHPFQNVMSLFFHPQRQSLDDYRNPGFSIIKPW